MRALCSFVRKGTSGPPLFSRFFLNGLVVCAALPLAFLLLPDKAVAASGATAPLTVWQAGQIKVTALQDRETDMAMSLFSGPASAAERAKYFTNGKTRSSVSTFLIQISGDAPKTILADAGYGALGPGKSFLPDALAAAGVTPGAVDIVLLTHMHTDHIGGLLKENGRAFPNAKIMVARPELDYWMELGRKDPAAANASLVRTVATAYGADLLPPFAVGAKLLPGVTAVDTRGHTPGHTAFLLESGGESLLIVGDLLHAAALQFPLPDENARYDMDAPGAAATRKRILNLAAEKQIPIAGMHIPFPGIGMVAKQGQGFAFTPMAAVK